MTRIHVSEPSDDLHRTMPTVNTIFLFRAQMIPLSFEMVNHMGKTCFLVLYGLPGRLSRQPYSILLLLHFLIFWILAITGDLIQRKYLSEPLHDIGICILISSVFASSWGFIAISVRRNHDMSLSGWSLLLYLILLSASLLFAPLHSAHEVRVSILIFLSVIALVLATYPGTEGVNRFGMPTVGLFATQPAPFTEDLFQVRQIKRASSRAAQRYCLFLIPSSMIYCATFRGPIFEWEWVLAAFLSIPMYWLFSIVGKKFNLVYSYQKERIFLRENDEKQSSSPLYTRFFYFGRMGLLNGYYLLLIFIPWIGSAYGNTMLLSVSVVLGLMLAFYMVIDAFSRIGMR